MKISSLLLAGSLVANVAIAGWLIVGRSSSAERLFAARSAASENRTSSLPAKPAGPGSSAASSSTPLWARIESSDQAGMIARLRAAGFPLTVIRAIVGEQVRAQFAERRRALVGEAAPFEFWKPSGIYGGAYSTDPKLRAELRDLTLRQTQAMKALLGNDATDSTNPEDPYNRQLYGAMPREKREQVSQISQDYADLSEQVRNAANGLMLQEDRDKLAYLEAEKRKDLSAVLSPEEIADYDLRSSSTTSNLKFRLASLDLTEQQFRAIYDIQKPLDEKFPSSLGIVSADQVRAKSDAQKEATAAIKAALGEPMGTAYERTLDQNYQAANRVVSRLNLPAETTQQVVDVQKDIESQAAALRSDRTMTADQKAVQSQAIYDNASSRLTTSLGSKGLTVYRENGGYWLDNLTPQKR